MKDILNYSDSCSNWLLQGHDLVTTGKSLSLRKSNASLNVGDSGYRLPQQRAIYVFEEDCKTIEITEAKAVASVTGETRETWAPGTRTPKITN